MDMTFRFKPTFCTSVTVDAMLQFLQASVVRMDRETLLSHDYVYVKQKDGIRGLALVNEEQDGEALSARVCRLVTVGSDANVRAAYQTDILSLVREDFPHRVEMSVNTLDSAWLDVKRVLSQEGFEETGSEENSKKFVWRGAA